MNPIAAVAAALTLLIYVPTCIQVWRGKLRLNAASYLLWILLDAIAAASIFVKGGNYLLPTAFVVGCVAVVVAILRSGSFKWTLVETLTSLLVLVSIVVWWRSGPVMATVVSTAAAIAAGLPQAWDIWRRPQDSAVWVWLSYTVVNALSTVAGRDWGISERLYPASFTVFTLVLTLLSLRKFARPPAPAA